MRILVSGAGGFLGKAFVALCRQNNYPVLLLKRNQAGFTASENQVLFQNSLLETALVAELQKFEPTIFVNFAWKGVSASARSEDQYRYNINMTLESIELASILGCKNWIGMGSQAEYGLKNIRVAESDTCNPISHYGKAKLSLSIAALGMCESLKIEGAWLRIFSLYGQNDHPTALIPMLISKMRKNEPINLTECSQTWDYLYVQDAVEAIHELLLHFKSGIYNLASGEEIILKEVVESVRKSTNSKSEIRYGAIPLHESSVRFLSADISKITKQTNWKPRFSLEDGIKRTILWYDKHIKV